jgi:hypothetical protein
MKHIIKPQSPPAGGGKGDAYFEDGVEKSKILYN